MNKEEIEELQKNYQEKLLECKIYENIINLINKFDNIVYLSLISVSF